MASIQSINTLNHRIAGLAKEFGTDSPIYKDAVATIKTIFGDKNITESKKTGYARVKESQANITNDLGVKGALNNIKTPGSIKREAKKDYKKEYGEEPSPEELKAFINGIFSFEQWFDENRTEIYKDARDGGQAGNTILSIMNITGRKKTKSELDDVINIWKGLNNEENKKRESIRAKIPEVNI